MIKAVIFDMDGVLIDSEPCWRQAVAEVFGKAGIPYTQADSARNQGIRIGDIVRDFYARYPVEGWSAEKLNAAVCQRVIDLALAEGKVMPGIPSILDFVSRNKLPLGLATSTPRPVAEVFICKIGIGDRLDALCTGDEVEKGKPDPEIYFLCARRLSVPARDCLVFEDSVMGVRAAKAAECRCIAVPEPTFFDDPRYGIADYKLRSLVDFDEKMAE